MYKALQSNIKEIANNPEVDKLVDSLNTCYHNMHETSIESLKSKIRWSLRLELDGLKDIAECLDERNKDRILRRVARIEKELEFEL